jgi:ubiquinone/menaquinone biosynthesis C-methylase UbiE
MEEEDLSFGSNNFWEQWYKNRSANSSVEWYLSYSELSDILAQHISTEDRILMIGCGNSLLSEQMYDAGYKHIVNIDFSKTVIDYMKKLPSKPGLEYMHMDACDMSQFEANSFDAIVDKGTIDSILSSPTSTSSLMKMFAEIKRVARSNSKYIVLSDGRAEERMHYFETAFPNANWSIQTQKLHRPHSTTNRDFSPYEDYWLYILQKK